MRRALVLLIFATSVVGPAGADRKTRDKGKDKDKVEAKQPAPPPPRTPGPDDAKVIAVLEKLVAAPDRASREAAIKELAPLAPRTIPAIGEWVVRPHASSIEERRKVLEAIKAQVPDKSGKFKTPDRTTAKERQADDDLDWLAKLLELPDMPGLGEVIGDVAALRALAATNDISAAQPLFDAAFVEHTMIYRDECGRYLRKMEPYSVPVLTKESAGKSYDRRRYATFQLERLDRQEPGKALASAAGNEALTIAILETYKATKIREAVHAVWTKVNDDAPRVRAAARDAFMDYITGPPPPPAPKKKLQLPGGKLTKKEKPLYLTYRELADNELRIAANELLHEDYPLDDPTSLTDYDTSEKAVKIDQPEVAKRLFEYYDTERAQKESAQWSAAKAKADAGDLATAVQMLDRLLAQNPQRGQREQMAAIYASWGKSLEEKQQWPEAAAAFSKAHGLDPKGAGATHALAAHHFAMGKALEAQGKDGGPDFRKAVALEPDYAPSAADSSSSGIDAPGKRPVWMLYAAIVAAVLAMALFAVAMVRRRAA